MRGDADSRVHNVASKIRDEGSPPVLERWSIGFT
jgi:hypothetical protein